MIEQEKRGNDMYQKPFAFLKASPVWKQGDEKVINQTLELETVLTVSSAVLRVAGSTLYEVLAGGELVAFGPARSGHGCYRCDEICLDPWLGKGPITLVIRVCGYNVNSYAYLDQPSFVCAEIVQGREVLAFTGAAGEGFDAYLYNDRMQKVQRYSFQRALCESYRLGKQIGREPVILTETEPKQFLEREVPYGEYPRFYPLEIAAKGEVTYAEKEDYVSKRFFDTVGEMAIDGIRRKGYPAQELEYISSVEYEKAVFAPFTSCQESAEVLELEADSYQDVKFQANRAGLIELDVWAEAEGTLFLYFGERHTEIDQEAFGRGMCSVIALQVTPGAHHFLSMEPYVFRYLRVFACGSAMKVTGLKQISVSYPQSRIQAVFGAEDPDMKLIYDAAINTFCDNTVDIFMDCPSRERAGWLCDSFFTARVEKVLTGENPVEKAFLYNFLYQEQDEHLPEGMLPMCYPSEHYNGNYIPNWAMWYVIELKEYVERTGDLQIVTDAKSKLYRLLDCFRTFENADGLLEKLGGWIFVDWSESNQLVQDVSYPSNMMYAYCLEAMSELYGDSDLKEKADRIRRVIREQSMTASGFFCDNALRTAEGTLELSGKCTEACQYYAFFTGTATPERYPQLFEILVNEFGFDRMERGAYPEIYPANAFIGNYIRLEILCRYGKNQALYDNIKGYFTYMAERTGTLWEMVSDHASMNHGFASHVIYWMEKLGLLENGRETAGK